MEKNITVIEYIIKKSYDEDKTVKGFVVVRTSDGKTHIDMEERTKEIAPKVQNIVKQYIANGYKLSRMQEFCNENGTPIKPC